MKKFRGTYTVLITPFTADGKKVDEAALRRLVDFQIAEGIHGLIPLGSGDEEMAGDGFEGAQDPLVVNSKTTTYWTPRSRRSSVSNLSSCKSWPPSETFSSEGSRYLSLLRTNSSAFSSCLS